MQTKKWYRFDGGPISRWGQATESQAIAYTEYHAKRYPDAACTEVAGEPADGTIINVDRWLEAAGIEVTEPEQAGKPPANWQRDSDIIHPDAPWNRPRA